MNRWCEKVVNLVTCILLCLVCTAEAFSVPHLFWPQRDIGESELNNSELQHRVLVASRSTDFKDTVVAQLKRSFAGRPFYVRFIGLKALDREQPTNYGTIVLKNTCMAWDMDRRVVRLLKRYPDLHGRVIVLTTSATGRWAPSARGRRYDALTAASETEFVRPTVDAIVKKIERLLGIGTESDSEGCSNGGTPHKE